MLKAVIFDLDHTLYDRDATLRNMAIPFKEALHIPEPADEVARALIIGEEQFYLEDFSFGGSRAIYPVLCRYLTMPTFEAYNNFINEQFAKYVAPYSFARPLLLHIRALGLRIGMVTNGQRVMQMEKLITLGIDDLIENLTCADDAGVLKPYPGIFTRCIEALDALPFQCLYVGDNPLDDIQGAIGTGMFSAWVKGQRPYPNTLPRPDYCINSIEELREIIPPLIS